MPVRGLIKGLSSLARAGDPTTRMRPLPPDVAKPLPETRVESHDASEREAMTQGSLAPFAPAGLRAVARAGPRSDLECHSLPGVGHA